MDNKVKKISEEDFAEYILKNFKSIISIELNEELVYVNPNYINDYASISEENKSEVL